MTLRFPLFIYGCHTWFFTTYFLVRKIRQSTNIASKILRDRRITSKKAKIEELQTGIVSKWQLSTDKRRERKSRISKKLFRNYKKLGIHLLV